MEEDEEAQSTIYWHESVDGSHSRWCPAGVIYMHNESKRLSAPAKWSPPLKVPALHPGRKRRSSYPKHASLRCGVNPLTQHRPIQPV